MEPDFPMALSRLQMMTKDELQELFTNESKFDDYIKCLDQMKQLYAEKELLMASNKSLAEYNLSQEPILLQKREAVVEKHREAIEKLSQLKITKDAIEAKSGRVKPDVLYALLQVAQSNAERDSENLTEDLLAGKIENIDEFLEIFMEKRKIYHLRRVKSDKMKELIEQRSKQVTPTRAAPRVPGNISTVPSRAAPGVPYQIAGAVAAPSNNWASFPTYQTPNTPYPLHDTGLPMP